MIKPFAYVLGCAIACAVALPVAAQPEKNAPAEGGGKADEKPRWAIQVTVLHGTNDKKGIDARVRSMKELEKLPFSAYDSYQVVTQDTLVVNPGEAKELELPNKRVLRTTLLEVLPKDSFRISASINQPGGESFLPLLKVKAKLSQPFIVAGQRFKRGILVLVIRVVAAPP